LRSLTSVTEVTADAVGGNPKLQAPKKLQTPKSQRNRRRESLRFGAWDLELGIWDFPQSGPSHYRDNEIPLPKLFLSAWFFESRAND
jgi:hypothetical protein